MYYSSIGIIAILIHLIINYDVLKFNPKDTIPARRIYQLFLAGVLFYYISDATWGLLYNLKLPVLAFIDTEIYFLLMAVTVFLWTRYVSAYLNEKNLLSRILFFSGWLFLIFELTVLILNIIWPIVFWFDTDGAYHINSARNINLYIQLGMFLLTAIYMLFKIIKARGTIKYRYRAVGCFGLVMTLFVWLQALYPLMPFYALGLMLGTCILHTFVVEDEKEENRREMKELLAREMEQEAELGTARYIAYTDPLTGIKNKSAYIEAIGLLERRVADNKLDNFGFIVFDLNGLKRINDTKGHEAGDKYIREASYLICNMFKHSPVYRIGGDEFVAFLEGEDFDNYEELIKKFNNLIEQNLKEGKVVISSGFAQFNKKNDDSITRVFERADKKMYSRKKQLKTLAKKK